ncbi:MAG: dUTP diphosphatase [Leptospiraceae bacterium]|nr:dUTP diphosphatase [Leptospiraceae bacterium]
MEIEIEKIFPDSILPERKTSGSVGYDLFSYCPNGIEIEKGKVSFIPTGIKIAIPNGYDGEIRPRSGLSTKERLIIPNSPGTIDSDYRGEILVAILNLSETNFLVSHKMRIAQLIIRKSYVIDWIEVSSLSSSTERGEKGFGSTGLKN